MQTKIDLSQRLELTPWVLQSIQILQMTIAELWSYVDDVFCENPMVDMDSMQEIPEEIRADRILQYERTYSQRSAMSADEHEAWLSQMPAAPVSLASYLKSQISVDKQEEHIRMLAHYIVGCLDEKGYFTEDPEEMARELSVPVLVFTKALDYVRSLEPAGVGAGNLQECLLLQLRRDGADPVAERIVKDYLEDFGKRKYSHITRELGVTQSAFSEACKHICSLNPIPGASFQAAPPQYIVPDIVISVDGTEVISQIRSDLLPQLTIDSYYLSLLKSTKDQETRQYLIKKLNQAKTLIQAIENRQSTLERCAQQIVEKQRSFFLEGEETTPMSLADIAETLELNVSTVSRALRDKYLRCDRGTFPVTFFFSRGVSGENGEAAVSPNAIKKQLKRLIHEENKQSPLSDQQLVQELEKAGIFAARRTVAKYRTELGLPSASGRRNRERETLS